MTRKADWRADFSIKKLLTLWCTQKWSVALGILMFFVGIGDVVFTLLDVERFGLAGEINPVTKFLIGAGGAFTVLWVAIALMSTILLYALLISLYLMLPIQTREGRVSTFISSILSARITVSLYGITIYGYSSLEAIAGMLILSVVLVFLLRFIMKNGEYLSWSTTKSALHGFGVFLISPITGFFSAISHPFRSRRQKATDGSRSPISMQEMNASGTAKRPPPFVVERSKRRIAILLGLVILLPLAMFAAFDYLYVVSGLADVPASRRSLYRLSSSIEGQVFLTGFVMTLIGVMLFAFLLMKLVDAFKGKPKFVQNV